jgi:threonine aldolase
MVWIDPSLLGFSLSDLSERAKSRGITLGASNRIVVHLQITQEAVGDLIEVVRELKEECRGRLGEGKAVDGRLNRMYAEGRYDGGVELPRERFVTYGRSEL